MVTYHATGLWGDEYIRSVSFNVLAVAITAVILSQIFHTVISFSLLFSLPTLTNSMLTSTDLSSLFIDYFLLFLLFGVPSIVFTKIFLIPNESLRGGSVLNNVLYILRIVCCIVAYISFTTILRELLSRQVLKAMVILAYSLLILCGSWLLPIFNHLYMHNFQVQGLVTFLPESLQELLLETTLLEWSTDTTFTDKIRPYMPFLLPLSKAEQTQILSTLPLETQITMTRPGLLPLLPESVQKALKPAEMDNASELDVTSQEESLVSNYFTSDVTSCGAEKSSSKMGFDFHLVPSEKKSNELTTNQASADVDIMGKIIRDKFMQSCRDIIWQPSPSALNRTASIASALLVLQLYSSHRSRQLVFRMLHASLTLTLVAIAGGSFIARCFQRSYSTQLTPLSNNSSHITRQYAWYYSMLRFMYGKLIGQQSKNSSTPSIQLFNEETEQNSCTDLEGRHKNSSENSTQVQDIATSLGVFVAVVCLVNKMRHLRTLPH